MTTENPLNGTGMKKSILNDKNRTNSFSSEPRCEDHPPIFGTKGDIWVNIFYLYYWIVKILSNQIDDCGIFFYCCSRENYCWRWNKWAWNSNMCIQSDICGWFKRGKNVNHLPSLQKWVRIFSYPTMKFVINLNPK